MPVARPLPRTVSRTFITGLATVLPLAITAYLLYWLGATAESLFGALVRIVLPDEWYFPGLGIAVAVVLIFTIGGSVKAWIFGKLFESGEQLIDRVPLVNTIYGGLRDLVRFVSEPEQRRQLGEVVLVSLTPDARVIGFITDREPHQGIPQLAGDGEDPVVAVYLPMGYQVGGYTLYLPESRIEPLDLSVEEAMRVVLTANINRPRPREP